MAGKSNRGRNRKGSQQTAVKSSEQAVSPVEPLSDSSSAIPANGDTSLSESNDIKTEVKDQDTASHQHPGKQADIHLYPVSVKTQGGEKLELQLSPGDSVMDVRQFLLDAPETCFFTCYDLLLHTKDGSIHHLEDYNEISEVADITGGNCFLEMIAALYDDRSIRAHVHRTRELLSLSTLHSSLSTTLALQHETVKNASANVGDPVKAEVPELDNLGFMENVTGSLTNLLSSPSKEIKCVESIVFSSFNPPPSQRRLYGDLIYLDVVTLEGNKYCITGTTKAFYVNSSAGSILDPRPNKAALEATSLVGLLQKISPKFKKAFREILERKASAHPFENVQSLLPPNSWLGLYPVPGNLKSFYSLGHIDKILDLFWTYFLYFLRWRPACYLIGLIVIIVQLHQKSRIVLFVVPLGTGDLLLAYTVNHVIRFQTSSSKNKILTNFRNLKTFFLLQKRETKYHLSKNF